MDKPTGSILKWDRSEGATFAGIGDDSSVGSNKSSQSNRNNRKLHCNEKVGMPELGNNVFTYIQPNQLSKYLKSKKAVAEYFCREHRWTDKDGAHVGLETTSEPGEIDMLLPSFNFFLVRESFRHIHSLDHCPQRKLSHPRTHFRCQEGIALIYQVLCKERLGAINHDCHKERSARARGKGKQQVME